jgi:hypothetical protein
MIGNSSLFFSVFALHVAAFGYVPRESSRGEKKARPSR